MPNRVMIPVRADLQAKAMIEHAAKVMGTNVSAFVLHYAYQAAKDVINDEHLVLANEDWELFISSLENPPKANKKLQKLLANNE